jgi:hypothetical protein
MPKRVVFAVLRGFTTPAARYPPDPRAVFILALCVVSGVPLIFADATPGSINSQLDPVWVVIWGIMLAAGALVNLIGTLKLDVNGVILEQIGSVAVGGASLLYSVAIFMSVQWKGFIPAAIVLGLGVSCFWRYGQLQALLHRAEKAATDAKQDGD